MNTLMITRRRMVKSPGGTHEHVGFVRLSDGAVLSRDDVFALMLRGVSLETLSSLGNHARVIRVHCSICSHDYLRTDADLSKDDNLDALPLF